MKERGAISHPHGETRREREREVGKRETRSRRERERYGERDRKGRQEREIGREKDRRKRAIEGRVRGRGRK